MSDSSMRLLHPRAYLGLLEPLVLDGLYKGPDGEKLSLQLIDGGVYDNQGTAGLLEQNCNVLVVSDASGNCQPSIAREARQCLSIFEPPMF